MTFASSLGQTFFIGAFGPSIQKEFNLKHADWGGIYMVGTILSALFLPWTGQLIDRLSLKPFTLFVLLGLCFAGLLIAITPTFWLLIPIIFLLRHTGQGLTSHIAITTMTRCFNGGRGKAVAITSLGYAVGESCLPLFVVLGVGIIGWRWTYGAATGLLLFVFLPFIIWLLKKGLEAEASGITDASDRETREESDRVSWTRSQVLKHWRFYLLVPAVLAPSFIITALFFHHLTLAESKQWSLVWITGSYWVYAIGSVTASLTFGPLIDQITAVRVVPYFLIPKTLALMIIWAFNDPMWAWPYLLLLGINVGMAYTGLTAMWAELYGPQHLGGIRSMVVSVTVLASALGPPCLGVMMDFGVSFEAICALLASYCGVATLLMFIGLHKFQSY